MQAGMTSLMVEVLPDIFSNLKPIPQNDGVDDSNICVIAYQKDFTIAYDYMRAVWNAKEFSERALKLSALCLKLNPANYTVWHYRRQCLEALDRSTDPSTIQNDLDLAASLGGDNPKNYQIWYHRRALLETLAKNSATTTNTNDDDTSNIFLQDFVPSELNYISTVLEEDGKNYHAWSHRQWVIRTANQSDIWERELEFAKELIRDDPRNNSAWNQRWFASHYGTTAAMTLERGKEEADFALVVGASLDPFNESPWRYMIAILREQHQQQTLSMELIDSYLTQTIELRTVVENANKDPDSCTNLTSARIDLLEFKGDKESLQMASSFAEELANKFDPIRKKYWMLRVNQINKRVAALTSSC